MTIASKLCVFYCAKISFSRYICDAMIEEKIIDQELKRAFAFPDFPQIPAGLYEPLNYMVSIGGKRLRPKFCLTAYSLFRDEIGRGVLDCAVALELFHTFTLIHDDIMDKSPLRRGKTTVWKKWNEDTAILSGDVMSIESYKRIAKAPSEHLPEILDLFSNTAEQVCEGQQFDIEFESRTDVPMDEYMNMISLKTAVLIATSGKIGAILGDAEEETANAIYRFGYDLGLAFQVADDYLDTYGDEKVFGKPIGGDIVNNKKSWLLTRALEKTSDKKEILDMLVLPVETPSQKMSKIAFVKGIYNRLGIGTDALEEINRLTGTALKNVAGLECFDVLKNFANSLVGRVK